MSQKEVRKPRQVANSQKPAVSAKESQSSRKEANKLTTKLHDLIGKEEWAHKQAKRYWKSAKEYEEMGMIQMAAAEKTSCEQQSRRAKQFRRLIRETEVELDRHYKLSQIGLQRGENYARMKVEEPPSSDQH